MTPYDLASFCCSEITKFLRAHEDKEGVLDVLQRQAAQLRSPRALTSNDQPVLRHLVRAVNSADEAFTPLVSAVQSVHPFLCWSQNPKYTDDVMGEGFSRNYAWAELIGSNGLLSGDDFVMGILLLGPGQHYIDHWHKAPELYVPLVGGAKWRKGEGDFVERKAGEIIWHPPMVKHAMKTGELPLLAVYAWTRDTDCEIFLPEDSQAT
jgi:Dimethlysulfonioproprionate lyase